MKVLMYCTAACPFCQAASPQLISLFGSQLLLSQYRCGTCGSYFEGVRDDRQEIQPLTPSNEGDKDGGCDDLYDLDRQGGLDPLLKATP